MPEPYPPLKARAAGHLDVGEGHQLFWEECGKPDGQPVLFVHGGPGAGCTVDHRRYFDPSRYRIILYDQRGAGRSMPLGGLEANTTWDLVADMERLREFLGVDHWLLFGGSWGSTLALAYAQRHPERVHGLILRGIFLGTRSEIDWFLYGMGHFFPEAAADFAASIPAGERGDLLGAYHVRLIDPDPAVHMPAARAWSLYEGRCSSLRPSPDIEAHFCDPTVALGIARIEAHYFMHDCWLEPDQLLNGIDEIRNLPAVIVQGRYDVVCPPRTAAALAEAWPEADFTIVPDAGHAASEPGTRSALVAATNRFADL